MPEYYNFIFFESKFHLLQTDFWHDTMSPINLHSTETTENYKNVTT